MGVLWLSFCRWRENGFLGLKPFEDMHIDLELNKMFNIEDAIDYNELWKYDEHRISCFQFFDLEWWI